MSTIVGRRRWAQNFMYCMCWEEMWPRFGAFECDVALAGLAELHVYDTPNVQ